MSSVLNRVKTGTTDRVSGLTRGIKLLRNETMTLVRQELSLAKAEMSQAGREMVKSAVQAAIALGVLFLGAILLGLAISGALAQLLAYLGVQAAVAAWLGPLITGAIIALIGGVMARQAVSRLDADHLKPEGTIASLKEDREFFQEKLSP
jgi:hypothetical protein